MSRVVLLAGNQSVAYGAKLARVEVIASYPITPQTAIVEYLANFVANGELDAEYINIESEHSAMSACIGAQATGARAFSATSAQGLVYMHELLFIASGLRLPIGMAIVNRQLSAPVGIWPDHCDSLAQRDTGWLQFYVESCQEALDMTIQAYRIGENKQVLLPVMVCLEGFTLGHTVERVDVPDQEEVDEFLPPYEPKHVILDPDRPMALGNLVDDRYFPEYKYQQKVAMEASKTVINQVDEEYGQRFGQKYGGLLETYMLEDANVGLITVGSMTTTARTVVRKLRKDGKKVGLVKLRSFRPFPKEELRKLAENLDLMAVLDRNISLGFGGIVYAELCATLYEMEERPHVMDFVVGLGGRDITVGTLTKIANLAVKAAEKGRVEKPVIWVEVRGV